MKILITGASGYLGKNFISNYSNSYAIKTFSLQNMSIDKLDCSNIDTVIHMAALVHQMHGATSDEYQRINVQYTIELAKKAKITGVKQFIFISSLAVYGNVNGVITEDTICSPITDYGKSKLDAEIMLQKMEDKDFIISIVRPPMIYGKNAPGNIVSLIKLINTVPILPFAKINNRRNFVYIDNLIHLINTIIDKKKSGIFLASDDDSISTTKLIQLIANKSNKKTYLVKIPFFESLLKLVKPSFHKRLYESLEVDNSITKEKLKLVNPYSTEDGIKLMINNEF